LGKSERYAEALKAFVEGDFFDPDSGDVAAEGPADGVDTVVDIFGSSLGQHFDGAIGHVADVAFEVVQVCFVEGGEPEADALDAALEDNMFCYSFHG
jgi:hypothetical protein